MRCMEDILKASNEGASYVGFIFYDKSPRYIEPKKVATLLSQLPTRSFKTVGVFVNQTIKEVKKIHQLTGIDMLQFHGDETREYLNHFPVKNIIKVLRLNTLDELNPWLDYPNILIDGDAGSSYGGCGIKANWC